MSKMELLNLTTPGIKHAFNLSAFAARSLERALLFYGYYTL